MRAFHFRALVGVLAVCVNGSVASAQLDQAYLSALRPECARPSLLTGAPRIRSSDLIRSSGEYRLVDLRLFAQIGFMPLPQSEQLVEIDAELLQSLRGGMGSGAADVQLRVPELPKLAEIPVGTLSIPRNASSISCLKANLEEVTIPEELSDSGAIRPEIKKYSVASMQVASSFPAVVEANRLQAPVLIEVGIQTVGAPNPIFGKFQYDPTQKLAPPFPFLEAQAAAALRQPRITGGHNNLQLVIERLADGRVRVALLSEQKVTSTQWIGVMGDDELPSPGIRIPLRGTSETVIFFEGIYRYIP